MSLNDFKNCANIGKISAIIIKELCFDPWVKAQASRPQK
jgi:hypothetical protein